MTGYQDSSHSNGRFVTRPINIIVWIVIIWPCGNLPGHPISSWPTQEVLCSQTQQWIINNLRVLVQEIYRSRAWSSPCLQMPCCQAISRHSDDCWIRHVFRCYQWHRITLSRPHEISVVMTNAISRNLTAFQVLKYWLKYKKITMVDLTCSSHSISFHFPKKMHHHHEDKPSSLKTESWLHSDSRFSVYIWHPLAA